MRFCNQAMRYTYLCSRCSHNLNEMDKLKRSDNICQTKSMMHNNEDRLKLKDQADSKHVSTDIGDASIISDNNETVSDTLFTKEYKELSTEVERSLNNESELTRSLSCSSSSESDLTSDVSLQPSNSLTLEHRVSPCGSHKTRESSVKVKSLIRARSSDQHHSHSSMQGDTTLSWEEMINNLYTQNQKKPIKNVKRGSSAPVVQHKISLNSPRLPFSATVSRPHLTKSNRENFLCHTFASLQKVREKANESRNVPPPSKRIRWVH